MSKEAPVYETDLEALQAAYNNAVDSGEMDGQEDTFEQFATEVGTTVEALESARVDREAAAGQRAADLLAKAREEGLLADGEDPDTWRKRKEDE